MSPRRNIAIVLPSLILFFAAAIFLLRNPGHYPVLVVLFVPSIVAIGVFISLDLASVFAAIVSLLEIICVGLLPGLDRLWVSLEIVPLWVTIYLLHRFTQREGIDEQRCADGLQHRQERLHAMQKEKESLSKRLVELENQAVLRQHLFNAVHQFASLLDPVVIRQRLMEFVRGAIGRGTIHFFAGNVPRDTMDRWVMERKLSLLVSDVSQDARFKPARSGNEVRSVLAAPMVVERQIIGVIRLHGFEPDMFSIGDLRVLEALSLMASLALENLQLIARLHEEAVRDNLTGLYTHRFFQERLSDEILRAGRYQSSFALLLLDIDHFKRYNDTYGHAAGDQVLVRVSQIFQHFARPVDLVARYGGEEFVMILPDATIEQARHVAETIRQAIAAESFHFGPEVTMREHVTVTIGLSNFPQEATTSSQLIRVADYRLYQGKEGGRNQVVG